ncbi:MAG TPA: ParA family protein [Terriglobales bacterium]|nr:ParA family protein [Terriglobales bacterium]
MARILAITNQKGGVGKTTTAINLAASLAAAEVPTLLVDCDPQGNASSGLGYPADPNRLSLYHGLRGEIPAESLPELLLPTAMDGLQILPASRDLVGLNLELVNEPDREQRLLQLLAPLREKFGFILLDCPPALDLLNLNALVAADGLIVPMQCEYFALEGVAQLIETVRSIRENFNPNLEIEGVLFTQLDERTNLSRQVADNLRQHFGDRVFKTVIPRNIRLAEAPSHGLPALIYDLRSRGAEAYLQLAHEVIEREQTRKPAAGHNSQPETSLGTWA